MTLMETIHRGKRPMPPRLMVYGIEGIGKSSWAADAPRPVFIQTEDGLGQIDCHKFPLARAFQDVMAALAALYTEKHEYQTVVLDSLDWLERIIWDQVCGEFGVKSIEKADGGYGKGYVLALTYWWQVLEGLEALRRDRDMATILIAHAKVEKFEDPESTAYDRYSPRLHKHACALVTEWADAVLFATRRFHTKSEEAGFNRTRTIAEAVGAEGGERILKTAGGPACIAKNRYSLPPELPLSWPALVAAMTAPASTSEGD
jgi:hypothetical protein